jgi:protein-S-isoprenylcysteine O-methyltransferase Ste14
MESFSNIFLAVTVYAVLHSVLASNTMKALAERRLGLFARRYYRFFYNLAAGITLLPVLWCVARLPDQPLYVIPMPFALVFQALQVAAVVGALATLAQTGILDFLGLSLQDEVASSGPLVVKGFYRWMRHPLYTFGFLFIWMTPNMTVNLLAFFLALTLYIVVGIYFEERKLLEVYGEAYAEYRSRTPMLIPPYF